MSNSAIVSNNEPTVTEAWWMNENDRQQQQLYDYKNIRCFDCDKKQPRIMKWDWVKMYVDADGYFYSSFQNVEDRLIHLCGTCSLDSQYDNGMPRLGISKAKL